jgi:hypothetical protein
MADFYLLPPRPAVGEEIARLIRPYLPGLRITAADSVRFLDTIVAATRGWAYLVHREDVPEGDDLAASIRQGFGAGPDDQIVQVSLGSRIGEPQFRLLTVEEAAPGTPTSRPASIAA